MSSSTVEIIRILAESILAAKYESDKARLMTQLEKIIDYHCKEVV